MRLLLPMMFLSLIAAGQGNHEEVIKRIYDEALVRGEVHENLRVLCKDIGHRLSGTPQAAAAVEYTRQLMQSYGFDTVYLQPVMVPHWERGPKEVVRVVNSDKMGSLTLNSIVLGNSVGTGPKGLVGEVVEVSGVREVDQLGKQLEGKIVFYNGSMDKTAIRTFNAYGRAVLQRVYGASEAAKYGAKAVIVRSLSINEDDVPHTGSVEYKPLINQIPAIAISTNDAELLSHLLDGQDDLKMYVRNESRMLADKLSYNVIGELRGEKFREEIIAVGGHLDSWDVGEGAHDDGSGCMQGVEVLRLFKALDLRPQRTLRAVMWMNEENGLAGGKEYARVAEERGERHILAIESDNGGFRPYGMAMVGSDDEIQKVQQWTRYFEPYGVWNFKESGSGADIGPLALQGTLLMGLRVNGQRYFNYHHTPADVFETVEKRELELGAATMASMVYLVDQEGLND